MWHLFDIFWVLINSHVCCFCNWILFCGLPIKCEQLGYCLKVKGIMRVQSFKIVFVSLLSSELVNLFITKFSLPLQGKCFACSCFLVLNFKVEVAGRISDTVCVSGILWTVYPFCELTLYPLHYYYQGEHKESGHTQFCMYVCNLTSFEPFNILFTHIVPAESAKKRACSVLFAV